MTDGNILLIEQLLNKQGNKFRSLPPEIQEQMKNDLRVRLDDAVFGALFRALPLLNRLKYYKISRTGTEHQRREYLIKNVPNKDAVVAREVDKFNRLYR